MSYFNFHNYDNLRHFTKKHDPRRGSDDDPVSTTQAYNSSVQVLYMYTQYNHMKDCMYSRVICPTQHHTCLPISSHQNKSVVNLMFAAYSGDVSALRRSV